MPFSRTTRLLAGALLASIVVGMSSTAATQDRAKFALQFYKVVLDDDHVRVIDYRLTPGEKEPMHSHPSGVLVYYLTDAKMLVTLPDGKTAEAINKAGDVIWRDPVTHFAQNTGSSEVHALLVEPKVSCKTPALPVSLPNSRSTIPTVPIAARLEPHHHIRYENQYLRVFRGNARTGRKLRAPHPFA
jgi:quercetin dioxygenase-like cupin family protein